MEKDSGSWFHHQHLNQQSFLGSPINIRSLNTVPACMNPYSIEDSTTGTCPLFPLQQLKASELNDSPNWFYCLSRFRQAFAHVPNSLSKEELPVGPLETFGQKGCPDIGRACIQKKFLVFDQSGDKTTLLYSCGAKTPVQCTTSWGPKPPATLNLINEEQKDITSPVGPIFKDEYLKYSFEDDLENEMHEDTEELNALLCSDSDGDCSEDDEETSIGHSPGTMTDSGIIQGMLEERSDRGSNYVGPTKRQKLPDLNYEVPSLVYSSRSAKTHTCSELEDDAESSCGNNIYQESNKLWSLSGRKRSRKERIHETVRILQGIIPGVKGKNATVVIDEAIDYLRSMKVKAKELGLGTL